MIWDRRTAKVVGVLFIVATVASLLGSVALGSVLDGSDYLATVAAHEGQVITAALFFLIASTSAFATAFLLFPTLRRHAEGLAAGYVGLRAFEKRVRRRVGGLYSGDVAGEPEATLPGRPTSHSWLFSVLR